MRLSLFWRVLADASSLQECATTLVRFYYRESTELGLIIRTLEARNNMRAMRQGDLAFFYHSNTKVPGIAGVMEIAQEHSPDGRHPLPSLMICPDLKFC